MFCVASNRMRLGGARKTTYFVIRVLLIGCGDVALRTAALLKDRARLYGLIRRDDEIPKLRARGIVPIVGDLDRFGSLDRLRTAPFAVLHFAPPPSEGRDEIGRAHV